MGETVRQYDKTLQKQEFKNDIVTFLNNTNSRRRQWAQWHILVTLTIHEAAVQHFQWRVRVHDYVFKKTFPEEVDVLRLLPLKPIQKLVEGLFDVVFASHVSQFLQKHMYTHICMYIYI